MIALKESECCALAGTDCRPTALRRRASRPQLKRDPLGSAQYAASSEPGRLRQGGKMRYIVRFHIPVESGNAAIRDPKFGDKMRDLLSELHAETAYFTAVDGQRGGYIVVNFDDAPKIPAVAEPLFRWLKADLEFIPVMLADDLGRAGSAISAAVKKWG